MGMFSNYIKIGFRNAIRQKFYASLNVAGLALGLTFSILIGLYIADELSFDRFHTNSESIYHVGLRINFDGEEIKTASSCPPLAQALVGGITGAEHATRLNPRRDVVLKFEDKAFTENRVLTVDSNFLYFFTFPLLEGNAKTALKEPHSIVLTPETAAKYFGKSSALGKIINVGNENDAFRVTGIAKPPPLNSHIQFDVLLTSGANEVFQDGGWGDIGLYTYYRKRESVPDDVITQSLRQIVTSQVAPELEDGFGVSFADFEQQGGVYEFFSYPLTSSHLFHPELQDGPTPSGDIQYVYILGAIGIFVMILACINFMNLSTARASNRFKEVGLRKTLGASKIKLAIQFLLESLSYVLVAACIACMSIYFLLPRFNLLAGKELSFSMISSPAILPSLILLLVAVSILAGSYPAFYLSSFRPIDVMRGKGITSHATKSVRSALVIFQFTISIALIICTIIVFKQLNFLEKKDIGMDKRNVIVLRNTNRLGTSQQAFRESLISQATIVNASYTDNVFPGVNTAHAFRPAGTTRDHLILDYHADYDHLSTLDINLSDGRYFSRDFPADSLACVINEAAAVELGWLDAVNKKLTVYDDAAQVDLQVIGVVRNFNFESFRMKVKPLIIRWKKNSNTILIRFSGSASNAIRTTENLWKKYAANEPFEYSFLNQNFDELFRVEFRLRKLLFILSGIAVFIATLGLLGLASFTAERRAKEIGVRKVMGASISSVNMLLTKQFMILVGIAFFFGSLFAWYAMDSWLQAFAYRINLDYLSFIAGGVIAASVAWLTISFHFIKAALLNPAIVLRYE